LKEEVVVVGSKLYPQTVEARKRIHERIHKNRTELVRRKLPASSHILERLQVDQEGGLE